MIRFTSLSLAVALTFTVYTSVDAAPTEMRTISVTGTAITRSVPDVIGWSIQTSDTDKELAAAKQRSDTKIRQILSLREKFGIEPQDFQTSHLNVRKVYRRDRQGNRNEFQHYLVTRSVSIKQRDLNRFDEFLSQLLTNTDAEVNFHFELSRRQEIQNATRLKALEAAKQKAQDMTHALDARLGKVMTISEQTPTISPRRMMANTIMAERAPAGGADAVSGTFAPGAIEVRVSAHVTFEIE